MKEVLQKIQDKNNLPIGIFDSGVGGLTVYRALHNRLPNEHFVYLGDTARVPYGTKSLATVERYALENSVFLASRGIKLLVVACNTASALALPKIRETIGIEVVGVIGPGARKAAKIAKKIAVIATEATVSSKAYEKSIKEARNDAEVRQNACPLFVPLAEEGWRNYETETRSIVKRYLSEFDDFQPDAIVLGCTHYPILSDVIQETVGKNVRLIDSGEACAEEVAELLKEKGLENQHIVEGKRKLCDDLDHFYVTDAAHRFAKVAERFLGEKPTKLEDIELSELKNNNS
ncbi:MAG: glutamate racemase [Pyrinomonadaceae bacterium]|jgi:glutamate racemase|nr:glutamate racemase [Pyrinomonadaceae bacterium]